MLTLGQIQLEVERLAAKIGASGYVLPTFGSSEDAGRSHVDVDSRGFHYVVVERGEELTRITITNLDDLLYHVFESVTFSLATEFELAHRVEKQDCRRMLFRRQIELLSVLSPKWAARKSREHNQVLQERPFDDLASVRAQFTKELRDSGQSAEGAWRAACDRYPLPSGSV